MRAIFLFLSRTALAGLLLAAPTHAAAARVLVVGDSLSDAWGMPHEAGWVHRLEERLRQEMGPDHTVINGAISGETTAGAAARIDELLESHHPEVVLVILGGNDGLRGLDPRQLEVHLATIIEAGQSAGAEVLLMQIRMPPNLGPAYVERFEAVYPRLADRFGIQLAPFFLDGIFDRPGMLMPDGIHPTEAAQPRMLEELWPHLRTLIESAE